MWARDGGEWIKAAAPVRKTERVGGEVKARWRRARAVGAEERKRVAPADRAKAIIGDATAVRVGVGGEGDGRNARFTN